MFQNFYGKGEVQNIVPYFWMPRWCGDVTDPSARILEVYDNKEKD